MEDLFHCLSFLSCLPSQSAFQLKLSKINRSMCSFMTGGATIWVKDLEKEMTQMEGYRVGKSSIRMKIEYNSLG